MPPCILQPTNPLRAGCDGSGTGTCITEAIPGLIACRYASSIGDQLVATNGRRHRILRCWIERGVRLVRNVWHMESLTITKDLFFARPATTAISTNNLNFLHWISPLARSDGAALLFFH